MKRSNDYLGSKRSVESGLARQPMRGTNLIQLVTGNLRRFGRNQSGNAALLQNKTTGRSLIGRWVRSAEYRERLLE